MKQEPVEVNEIVGGVVRGVVRGLGALKKSRVNTRGLQAGGLEVRRLKIKNAMDPSRASRAARRFGAYNPFGGTVVSAYVAGAAGAAGRGGLRAAARNLKTTRSGSVGTVRGSRKFSKPIGTVPVVGTISRPTRKSTGVEYRLTGSKPGAIDINDPGSRKAIGRPEIDRDALKKKAAAYRANIRGERTGSKMGTGFGRPGVVSVPRPSDPATLRKGGGKRPFYRTPKLGVISTDESFAPLEKTRARLSEMYGQGTVVNMYDGSTTTAAASAVSHRKENKNNTAFEPRYFKGTDTKSAIQQAIDYVENLRSRGLAADQMNTPPYAEAIRMMSDRKLMSQNMDKFIDAKAEKTPIGDQAAPTQGELEMIKARNRQRADKARQLTKDISAKFKAQSNRNSILNTSNRFRQGHQSGVDATERSRRETARTTMSAAARASARERRSRGGMSALDRLLRPAFDPSTLPRM